VSGTAKDFTQRVQRNGGDKSEKDRETYRGDAAALRKPKATAARFDESEPAATKSTSTTPASKEKAGGRYKVKINDARLKGAIATMRFRWSLTSLPWALRMWAS
jgi:hypothetical protein